MLTATSRVCGACHVLLPEPPAPQVCPGCSRVAVPLHTEWPPKMKRWLLGRFIKHFFAPWTTATEQYRWERLLRTVMAGRQWGTTTVPYASSMEDCFAAACTQITQWESEGEPTLY